MVSSPFEHPNNGFVLSTQRKYALLAIFCLAQFIDAFSITALFSAIPSLVVSLRMTAAESSWIVSSFTLTFASFLLLSGRISDVYNPKYAFIIGLCSLGFISFGEGFVKNKITLIILRAISGIAASLTIPSAMTLLTRLFTLPSEQARAIGIFGSCGAVGDILGLVVGAIFVRFSSIDRGWRWVFWSLAMVALPIAMIGAILIPPQEPATVRHVPVTSKLKSFDIIGVSVLTVSLILLIFAITAGSSVGWKAPSVFAPFVISFILMGCFFYWETLIPAEIAVVPPRTWFCPNFAVLFALALLPFFWWTAIFITFSTLWQDAYHWTATASAAHLVPLGIASTIIGFTGSLSTRYSPKRILLVANVLLLAGTALLSFADSPENYWSVTFPAFLVGSTGAMLTYTHANIAIFKTAPSSMRGTIGAIFNGALQLGSAVGISVVNAIQVSVDARAGGLKTYKGIVVAFWFMVAVICVEAIAIVIFYKDGGDGPESQAIVITLNDSAEGKEM